MRTSVAGMAVSLAPAPPWSPSLERPRLGLGRDELHLWFVELDDPSLDVERLAGGLTTAERAAAGRCRYPRDRRRRLVMRSALRTVLGRYLGLPGEEVGFGRGAYGKPFLAHETELAFNNTDCDGLGAVCVSLGREVGVDLEAPRAGLDYLRLARHFFDPRETARLAALQGNARERAFLECWTRKEAYTKARGEGLSLPLDSFEVVFGPGSEPRLARVADRPGDVDRYAVVAAPAPAPCVASVLVERRAPGERWTLRGRVWDAAALRFTCAP
jgi:4'-phosphopantetheinyl transferase